MKDTNISVSEFVLSCLKETDPKDGIGVVFLLIYLVTIFGNVTVILIVVMDQQLQRPMYMCIVILSVIDVTCSTTIIMKILVALLFKNTVIPRNACYVQMLMFFMHYMESLEIFLLTLMAFDRYVAVNYPLRYPSLITNKTILVSIAFMNALTVMLVSMGLSFVADFNFCTTNVLPYCFCDFTAMLRIACFKDDRYIILTSTLAAVFIVFTFVLIIFSYTKIIVAALKTARTEGKRKALSTCFTHLSIVGLFYIPLFFSYVIPARKQITNSSVTSSLIMVATIIPPLLNPLIYSLRNKEIKQTLLILSSPIH
uniref:Olfactory receptor n=1 Tax=Erpetoichthys calabaricus TaxID=27687 RepID=A0A8C4SR68_ERPCA